MNIEDGESIRDHWRCFVACGLAILAPFQYGVDFGLIGGLQAMPGFLEQLISSLMTLGAFIMMTTTNINALYVGRLLNGLANGYFVTFSQLFIQESSPAKYRGLFLSAFQFCTSLGTLIGTIVDFATSTRPNRSAYLIPLGIIYIVPVTLTAGLIFIPESPRWLALQGRFEQSRKSLKWLRPSGAPVDTELAEIRAALDKEHEMGNGVGILDMFKNEVDRRRTFLSIFSITLQAASGAMFIIAYKAYFFTMARIPNAFAMSCVLSITGLVAILINSLIVVRYGRRRVLLTGGLSICGILQLIIAVVYAKKPGARVTGSVIVALSCLYLMAYNGMVAAYAWLAGGEIPSQRLRTVGFLGAWITTFIAPYFINPGALSWGPKYGFVWFPSCVIASLYVFLYLPETHSRTLEEIDEMFGQYQSGRGVTIEEKVGVQHEE
ncbi:general substrate transporter [Xylariaceae sp. FL1651]|nr:general substrate transporter [Xylariaceae sp. FL1651]